MPAQPPFLTPTRTPIMVLAAFAITYLIRSAAASVSRITWGLGRELAIAGSFSLLSTWDRIAPSATHQHSRRFDGSTHHILSTARASSDIRLCSQGGSQTIVTL